MKDSNLEINVFCPADAAGRYWGGCPSTAGSDRMPKENAAGRDCPPTPPAMGSKVMWGNY